MCFPSLGLGRSVLGRPLPSGSLGSPRRVRAARAGARRRCAAAVRARALRRPGGAGIAGVPKLASRGSTVPRTFFQTPINETSRRRGRRRRRRTRRQARKSRGILRSRRKERVPHCVPEVRGAARPPAVGATRPPPASRSPPLPGRPRPGRTESRHTAAGGGSPRQPSWDGGSQPPPGTREATCVLEANFCLLGKVALAFFCLLFVEKCPLTRPNPGRLGCCPVSECPSVGYPRQGAGLDTPGLGGPGASGAAPLRALAKAGRDVSGGGGWAPGARNSWPGSDFTSLFLPGGKEPLLRVYSGAGPDLVSTPPEPGAVFAGCGRWHRRLGCCGALGGGQWQCVLRECAVYGGAAASHL